MSHQCTHLRLHCRTQGLIAEEKSVGKIVLSSLGWAAFVAGFVGGLTNLSYSAFTTPAAALVVACALALKQFFLIVLQMRAKIAQGISATPAEGKNVVFIVFKPLILAYPWAPLTSNDDASRVGRCLASNTETELFFIAMALACSSVIGENVVLTVVYFVFMYARILHSLFFVLVHLTGPEPRSFAYDFCFFSFGILAVYGLVSRPHNADHPALERKAHSRRHCTQVVGAM